MGGITLYEGNGANQNIVANYDDTDYAGRVTPSDEARSMKLYDVKAGTRIIVYDSNDGSTDKPYCVIQVKADVGQYIVPTFERNIDDPAVSIEFNGYDGLDGKVSYIKIMAA
ncbi:hypothetical protein BJ944DRAFT_265268 [Cunninghamella echinulata]|nr:hypothetical protein BJ944DRAFT_265268 [Cunninghamella echinulata]